MSSDEYEVKTSSKEEQDQDIYDDEYIETLEEDDEISPEEEAFMQGYKDAYNKKDSSKAEEEEEEF